MSVDQRWSSSGPPSGHTPPRPRQCRTAISSNPGYATAHQWYGNFLSLMARDDESFAEFAKAVTLDPLSSLKLGALGWSYYFARRFDDAVAQCRRALELDPQLAVAHLWLGLGLDGAGLAQEAIGAYEEAVRLTRGEPLALAFLTHGLARAGRAVEAEQRFRELRELSTRRYVSSYDLAVICAGMGQVNDALEMLERGYQERTHWMALLQVDPRLDSLRETPRFAQLVESMKFPRRP